MEDNIRIELRCGGGELYRMLIGIGFIVLMIWLCLVIHTFSWGGLIAFLIASGIYIAICVAYEKKTQIITADKDHLSYQHFSSKSIKLSDIKRLVCEPYSVRSRYDTLQYIKLIIITADDEIELHDRIDANKMLTNKIESKETDIPLIRLYEFLKEKTGLYNDMSSEKQ